VSEQIFATGNGKWVRIPCGHATVKVSFKLPSQETNQCDKLLHLVTNDD